MTVNLRSFCFHHTQIDFLFLLIFLLSSRNIFILQQELNTMTFEMQMANHCAFNSFNQISGILCFDTLKVVYKFLYFMFI